MLCIMHNSLYMDDDPGKGFCFLLEKAYWHIENTFTNRKPCSIMVKNKGGMYMELRICSCDADIRALAALATEIWHEYFTAIISKEQIDYMVEKFQSYPVLKKAIEEENYTYFLAYEEGAMIGFCGVKPEKDRLFLSKLYLHKKARGKGLSSILLKRAISFAREQDKKAIYLTCNKFNQHSLDVYRAKGFKDIDSVQTDIGQGFIMDDYILQL